jgi:hypothetical protein
LSGIITIGVHVNSDERIRELCQQVIAAHEADEEFEPALQELNAALHEHLDPTRERLLAVEFLTARENQLKAA